MNGSEIILLLFLVRLVLPFGLLLLVGEWGAINSQLLAEIVRRHGYP